MTRQAQNLNVGEFFMAKPVIGEMVYAQRYTGRASFAHSVSISDGQLAKRFPLRRSEIGVVTIPPFLSALLQMVLFALPSSLRRLAIGALSIQQRTLSDLFNVHKTPLGRGSLGKRLSEVAESCPSRSEERSRQATRSLRFPHIARWPWLIVEFARSGALNGPQPSQRRPSVSPTVHASADAPGSVISFQWCQRRFPAHHWGQRPRACQPYGHWPYEFSPACGFPQEVSVYPCVFKESSIK